MTIKILIFGQGCLYFFRNIETRICSDSKIYQIKDPGYLDNEDNSNLILILDIKNSITILLK